MLSRIRIFVTDKNLIEALKKLEPSCNFYSILPKIINRDFINVVIVHEIPEKILKNVKYILLSENQNEISEKILDNLFDLWIEPLTPLLLKFYFKKLMRQLKSELEINSEELEHQKRIVEMARQDYLTGLATRWYLQEHIESHKDEENMTCIYFDLDNFKFVNDNYGHQAGDRALAATAEMMQRDFTDGFAARMGGDEFMVVLMGERHVKDVENKVNLFMKNLLEYYKGTQTMKNLSVSAGISQKLKGEEKTIDRLIHEADVALYEAKKNGRACCKIYRSSMEL